MHKDTSRSAISAWICSVLFGLSLISPFSHADLFDELDAETGFDDAVFEAQQTDLQSHSEDAFSSLETETQHGTQSQSKEELDAEFESWKAAYFAELKQYKQEILGIWDEAEVTDKTVWVEYSDDYKTKKVIDYEKNEIRISVVDDASTHSQESNFEEYLSDILSTTPNEAREADPTLGVIEANTEINDSANTSSMLSEIVSNPSDTAETKAQAKQLLKTAEVKKAVPATKAGHSPKTTVTIKLPNSSIINRARKYSQYVDTYAGKNNLEKSLVYAVMHTESAFNPMARSGIPAFGLMQIVPGSAGRDVAQRIYGEDRLFEAKYLYDAKNNIEAGSTYLNILYFSYLKKITNPESRTYCAIAAYNTGAGNVSVAFTGNRKLSKAIPIINSMTPEQVYQTLLKKLPYEETQHYLERVTKRQQMYHQAKL